VKRHGESVRAVGLTAAVMLTQVAVALADATTKAATEQQRNEAARFSETLLWSLVVLVAFFFAAGAIVVFSRRFRTYLTGGRRSDPTPSDDVWQMHKPPSQMPLDPDDEDRA